MGFHRSFEEGHCLTHFVMYVEKRKMLKLNPDVTFFKGPWFKKSSTLYVLAGAVNKMYHIGWLFWCFWLLRIPCGAETFVAVQSLPLLSVRILNPWNTEICNLNFLSLEVVSRYRDTQLQVTENLCDL